MDRQTRPDKRVTEARAIKAKLVAKGLRFADIDRTYRLPEGTARQALREPNLPGERAIAAALGTRAHLLWRSRYHASGQRKSPLNFTKIRLTETSRKQEMAQT